MRHLAFWPSDRHAKLSGAKRRGEACQESKSKRHPEMLIDRDSPFNVVYDSDRFTCDHGGYGRHSKAPNRFISSFSSTAQVENNG